MQFHRVALGGDTNDVVAAVGRQDPDDLPSLVAELVAGLAAGPPAVAGERLELHLLAEAVLGDQEKLGPLLHPGHAGQLVALGEPDAGYPTGGPAHRPHGGLGEAQGQPLAGDQDQIVAPLGEHGADQLVPAVQLDGHDAAGLGVGELGGLHLLHHPPDRGHEEEGLLAELRQEGHRGDFLVGGDGQQGLDVRAAGGAAGLGDLVHLEPEGPALAGDEQHVVVRGGDEQLLDEVVIAQARGGGALAPPALALVGGYRQTLDEALVGDQDHHIFLGDQVLDVDLLHLVVQDLGASRVPVLVGQLLGLLFHYAQDLLFAGQQRLEVLDSLLHLPQLLQDLFGLQAGELLQPHVQDGLGLDLGELEAPHQTAPGGVHVLRLLDEGDHRVDVVQGDLQAFQDVGALLGLAQLVA